MVVDVNIHEAKTHLSRLLEQALAQSDLLPAFEQALRHAHTQAK